MNKKILYVIALLLTFISGMNVGMGLVTLIIEVPVELNFLKFTWFDIVYAIVDLGCASYIISIANKVER